MRQCSATAIRHVGPYPSRDRIRNAISRRTVTNQYQCRGCSQILRLRQPSEPYQSTTVPKTSKVSALTLEGAFCIALSLSVIRNLPRRMGSFPFSTHITSYTNLSQLSIELFHLCPQTDICSDPFIRFRRGITVRKSL